MKRFWFALSLVLLAALSRLLPHLPNVAPITALALFGGAYFGRRLAFFVPLAAMLASDLILGFSGVTLWVYGSIAATVVIGFWLQGNRTAFRIMGASLAGSVLFFIVTNFGTWVTELDTYPHTLSGLAQCYVAAIPFFRNTVLGDLAYTAAIFGAFEAAVKLLPALRERPANLMV